MGADHLVCGAPRARRGDAMTCNECSKEIPGGAAAVKLVESLVGLGIKTSKAGAYAAPLPKRYRGEFARYSPTDT